MMNLGGHWSFDVHVRTGVCFRLNVLGVGCWFIHVGQGNDKGEDHGSRKYWRMRVFLHASYLGRLQLRKEDRRSAALQGRKEELDLGSKTVSGGAGRLGVMGGLRGMSFIDMRHGAEGGAWSGLQLGVQRLGMA
jgi:hypothetical protein